MNELSPLLLAIAGPILMGLLRRVGIKKGMQQIGTILDSIFSSPAQVAAATQTAALGNGSTTALLQSVGVQNYLATRLDTQDKELERHRKRIVELEEKVAIRDSRIEYLENENKRLSELEARIKQIEIERRERDDIIAKMTTEIAELKKNQQEKSNGS